MFNNGRYITSGVNNEIPLEIQIGLWSLIDSMNEEKDFFQVFELIPNGSSTNIIHRQEQPNYSKSYRIAIDIQNNHKLFCIDNGEVSTLMLSEEY